MNSKFQKILPTLLVLALVVTTMATILSLSRITNLDTYLTGAASTNTSTGISNLTIMALTSITNQMTYVNFGSGYVNASCSNCTMNSDGYIMSSCCLGDFAAVTSGFLLENTGNINLSVNYSCSGNCNGTYFIGGTAPYFRMNLTTNNVAGQSGETGAADTVASCNNFLNFTSWTDVSNNGNWLCGAMTDYKLDFIDSRDAIVIDLEVVIPSDAPGGSGQKAATFTFKGHSSG